MEKALMEKAINTMKSAGVKAYGFYARGGNIEMRHNGKDVFLFLMSDYVVAVRPAPPFANLKDRGSNAEISFVPYDNIDYVFSYDPDTAETMDILKSAGVSEADIKLVAQSVGGRYAPNNNSKAGLEGDIYDNDGNKTTSAARAGYVVQ